MSKLLLVIVSLILGTASSATINTYNKLQFFDNENLQNDSGIQSKVLWNYAVPSYMREVIDIIKKQDHSTLQQPLERLLEGVDSDDCRTHVQKLIASLLDTATIWRDEGKWAMQMVDAWGKPPEGLLTGHINLYGDFHECIQVKADELDLGATQFPDATPNLKGRYCTSYLFDYNTAMMATERGGSESGADEDTGKGSGGMGGIGVKDAVSLEELVLTVLTQQASLTMMFPTFGSCFPNTCSHMDVQNILVNMFNLTYSLIEEQVSPTMLPWPVTVACFTDEKKPLDAAAICVVVLLSILVALALSSAVLDYYLQTYRRDMTISSPAFKYFMAFSLYTNTKKWLSTRKSPDDLGCLHGIRFLSTAWVVLAHSYYVFMKQPQWNMIDVKNIWKDWSLLAVINGTFSVDTFFVMSGMLATYNILKLLDKTKGKFNVPMFYVHRYIRLTPTYAILVGIAATLLSYSGKGPFWHNIEKAEQNCRDNWWLNILYINNLKNTGNMCNGESWYLANDMQFYILAPLIVYPMWRWEMMGMLLLTVYTILSLISPVLVVEYSKAPPLMAVVAKDIGLENMVEIYNRPWSRIQAFIAGIWLGLLLHKIRGKRLKLHPLLIVLGWALSTTIALLLLFGPYEWFKPHTLIPKVPSYFYAALSRFSWGLVISWVVFACVKGYGGIINKFLSWKVFMPLGRLCFCVYLTSIHLQDLFHARETQPMRYDTYTMVNLFFAHLVMSCCAGFVCTMLFESPFIVLHKLLFEGSQPKKPAPTFINGPYSPDKKDVNKNDVKA